MKKVLVLVPHQDDEINIAGCLFETLHHHNVEVTVVFSTNGDSFPLLASTRYDEAVKVKGILPYNRIIYLGYGDEYKGAHIYDLRDGGTAISLSGRKETYFPGKGAEFCWGKNGSHHSYTRNNFKKDIRDVIIELLPDVIICVDLDSHPDHRCLSLLFDEVMGEVLKEAYNYRPLILKKFAYLGVWLGANDFFDTTVNDTKGIILGKEVSSYPYSWDSRFRLTVPDNYYSLFFWRTPIFKAINCYKTQSITLNEKNSGLLSFPKIVNRDMVFWVRRSDSLALTASISATSGDVDYLTDFKLYDTNNIRTNNLLEDGLFWVPSIRDKEKCISFIFDSPVDISLIKIYQHLNLGVKKVEIVFNNGFRVLKDCEQAAEACILVPIQHDIKQMYIRILEGYSEIIKIGEIEVFSSLYGDEKIMDVFNINDTTLKDGKRNKFICAFFETLYRGYCEIKIRLNNYIFRNRLCSQR